MNDNDENRHSFLTPDGFCSVDGCTICSDRRPTISEKVANDAMTPNVGGPVKDDPILQFFRYGHLPPHLREVSQPFGVLAMRLIALVPRNPERTAALRKLLEAKDAAVRAKVYEG